MPFFLNQILIENLTDQQKLAIANIISSQKFKKGDVIVAEGDPASSFYVIKEGTVVVLKGDKELRKMG
jgi:cGMP-dependent protein kinase 1